MRKNYNKNVHEMQNCTEKNTKKAVKFQLILYLEMHFQLLAWTYSSIDFRSN